MLKRALSLFLVSPLLLVAGPALALNPTAAGAASGGTAPRAANSYKVNNLVSDQPGQASFTDPNLVNAWGLAAGPSSPWWVADNGTDVSTLYYGDGTPISLVVRVPGAPTGMVYNGTPSFVIHHGGSRASSAFLFATESGTIRGWNGAVPPPPPSTRTFVVVNRSAEGAIYKGLAIASTLGGPFLYAADFHNGRVDIFDGHFHLVSRPGAFVDPRLPDRFAPFGIQNLGGIIYVTYAKQDADAADDLHGPGLGYVDAFDTNGTLLSRIASRGELNAPWGLALAPASFGRFGGDLLVGNFGDGQINAYRLRPNGVHPHLGKLRAPDGSPVVIDGLWALAFGNGAQAGSTGTLFFTAGPDDESHGLFGSIEATG